MTRAAEPSVSRTRAGALRAVASAAVFMLLVGAGALHGAPISFAVAAPPPEQVNFKHLWNITLHNPAPDTSSVSFRVEAREVGAGAVFSASTQSIALAPGERRLTAQDIKLSDVWCKQGYEAFVGLDSVLPEGDYAYTVTLDPRMPQAALFFRIRKPESIELAWPPSDAVIRDSRPVLVWKPPDVSRPLGSYRYAVRLVEVRRGQTATSALGRNRPVFEDRRVPAAACRVPPRIRLVPGRTYAWRVGLSDTAGMSFDSAHTQSQAGSFVYKPGASQQDTSTYFTFPQSGRSVTGHTSLVVTSNVPDAELCVLEYSLGSDSVHADWHMIGYFPRGQTSFVGTWASDSAVVRAGKTFPSPCILRATVLGRQGQRGEAALLPLVINPPPPPTRRGCGCR